MRSINYSNFSSQRLRRTSARLYGPMGQKFNFTWIIESDSVDKHIETMKSLIRPPAMTHYITEILIPQELSE